MRRATNDQQKHVRRAAILASGWELFQRMPFEAITISAVAEHVGLAKGTIYLYFATKEELFLALTEAELGEWFADLGAALGNISGSIAVATLFCDTLLQRPALLRLLAMLHSTLEHNISLDEATAFKRFLLSQMATCGTALENALPFLPPGSGTSLLVQAQALIIGFHHITTQSPVVQQALSDLDFAAFHTDFATEFRTAFAALLRGYEAQQLDTRS
jgi:AcrR family transcriptional regulator